MDIREDAAIRLPVRVAKPVFDHGTIGAFRVVDATNRVICEVKGGRPTVADEIAAALNKTTI